jgi:hypothetical protein
MKDLPYSLTGIHHRISARSYIPFSFINGIDMVMNNYENEAEKIFLITREIQNLHIYNQLIL